MIEIKGLHNTARCFTDELEPIAAGQIQAVCEEEAFAGSRIRVMPNVHAGMGCTIGTTMTISDKVVPGMVGVDIGCGMETVRLEKCHIDFYALDACTAFSGPEISTKVIKELLFVFITKCL